MNEGAYMETLHRFIQRAVDSGRGLDERDGDGRTALHWAAANGFQVRHRFVLPASSASARPCELMTRFPRLRHFTSHQDQVAALLDAGADPNSACQYVRQTPLYMAASNALPRRVLSPPTPGSFRHCRKPADCWVRRMGTHRVSEGIAAAWSRPLESR